MKQLR